MGCGGGIFPLTSKDGWDGITASIDGGCGGGGMFPINGRDVECDIGSDGGSGGVGIDDSGGSTPFMVGGGGG